LRAVGLSGGARQLACATALNRLIEPASEHATPAWIRRTALPDILGTSFDGLVEDALYRILDKLHPHRAAIEAALIERERSLFNLDRTIYLYDLTSSYFEGQAATNGKAQRGYSRDHRPDCKQVVIGLVVNRDGFRSRMRSLPATPRTAPRWPPCSICSKPASASPKAAPWWSIAAWPMRKTSLRSKPASCII
jgi:hypothetical protein